MTSETDNFAKLLAELAHYFAYSDESINFTSVQRCFVYFFLCVFHLELKHAPCVSRVLSQKINTLHDRGRQTFLHFGSV